MPCADVKQVRVVLEVQGAAAWPNAVLHDPSECQTVPAKLC